MKRLIVLMLLGFAVVPTMAQDPPDTKKFDFPRRNSVYYQNFVIFPTVNYDVLLPAGPKFGFIPKIGFGFYGELAPIFGIGTFYGGQRHFAEMGLEYWAFEGSAINLNYRYMGTKGLMFKAGFSYIPGEEAFPLLSAGYSF